MHINASCGGEGVCGKCRILLEEGELDSLRSGLLSDEDWNLGYRQACQSKVLSDVVVRIPAGIPPGPPHPDPAPGRRRPQAQPHRPGGLEGRGPL